MSYRSRATFILTTGLIFSSILTAGGIKGTVKYEGKVPRMKPIKMAADPICDGKHAEGPARLEWLLAGSEGELKNVFVYVKEGLGDKKFAAPEKVATIDQNGCVYKPHILGVQVGQKIEILNSDGTLHNVHAMPKKKNNVAFNEAMPGARKKVTKQFDEAEIMVRVKCDVHPWMGAYIGVFDHPCFAVSGDDGTYIISDLKPGEYVIEAWHEKLGSQTANVTVSDSAAHQNFTFKKPSKKK